MSFQKAVSFQKKALGLALAIGLSACGLNDLPNAKPTTGRMPTVAEIPDASETVRGENDPPIVTLEIGTALREKRLTRTEELPSNIIIPSTNLSGVPITTALEAVLAGTDVSLSWGSTEEWEGRLVSVTNLSGPLPKVVEKICNSAKVFCTYRNGLMELKEKETFMIDLPAVPGGVGGSSSGSTNASSGSSNNSSLSSTAAASTANSMADSISELAGTRVRIDTQGGNLIYSTDVEGQEMVRQYLDELRNGRPLVVMQMHIWEVQLDRENAAGINWSNFSNFNFGGNWQHLALTGLNTAMSSVTSPGVSLGATLSGKLDAKAVLQFLNTQGRVQTISSPQLTFVSGSTAEFRVGGKQYYVSEVGEMVSTSTTTSTGGVGTNTVTTDSVDTGLTIGINGSYENGVVIANLNMAIQNLVDLKSVDTGTTKIQLPITSERKVSTMLRVRPGDNLVLAGMVSSRDNNNREGIPLPFSSALGSYKSDEIQNSELVIMVRPSIVLFSDKKITLEQKIREQTRHQNDETPAAVVIDKDGSRDVAIDDVKAEATRMRPKDDTNSVNRNLMQRGLSHAFDDLNMPEGANR